jgi:hypothetical protein
MAMRTVADYAEAFARDAKLGKQPRVRIRNQHAAAFLGALIRLGVEIASDCLEQIRDAELREQIRTLLMAAGAGAAIGAAIGTSFGPNGTAIGACVGAGIGTVAAVFAIRVRFSEDAGPGARDVVIEAA